MYIALDIETTGFNTNIDEIIEIGAVKFNEKGEIIETFSELINPQKPIPKFVKHITGIDEKKVKNARTFKEAKKDIKKFLKKHPIIGHNIEFDTNFLKAKGIKLKNAEYDTLTLSSSIYRNLSSYSLETLANKFKLKNKNTHRALDDALLSMELFLGLSKEYQKLSPGLLKELEKISKKSKNPLQKLFKNFKKQRFNAKITLDLKEKNPKEKKIKTLKKISDNSLIEVNENYKKIVEKLENKKEIIISTDKKTFNNYTKSKLIKKDIYSNYISIEKLNKFLKRKKLNKDDFNAILKTLIFIEQTNTNEIPINRIATFGKEKKILKTLKKDLNDKKEQFKKKKSYLCTHDFLINENIKNKEIYLINIEEFSKRFEKNHSQEISLEKIFKLIKKIPTKKTRKNIKNKTLTTFGIIGIFLNKYIKSNTEIEIKKIFKKTKEWQNIQDSINNLYTTVNDSKDRIKSRPVLKEIIKLKKIFINTDFKNFKHTIKLNFQKEPIIRSQAKNLEKLTTNFLKQNKKHILINQNIDLNDQGNFFKKLYNINKETKFKKLHKTRIKTQISIESEHKLKEYIKNLKGNTAIICRNKSTINKLTIQLKRTFEGKTCISQSLGSLGKITNQFKTQKKEKILIINHNSFLNFTQSKKIQNLLILKIPKLQIDSEIFQNNYDKFKSEEKKFKESFCLLELKKLIKKVCDNKKEKNIIIFDNKAKESEKNEKLLTKLKKVL